MGQCLCWHFSLNNRLRVCGRDLNLGVLMPHDTPKTSSFYVLAWGWVQSHFKNKCKMGTYQHPLYVRGGSIGSLKRAVRILSVFKVTTFAHRPHSTPMQPSCFHDLRALINGHSSFQNWFGKRKLSASLVYLSLCLRQERTCSDFLLVNVKKRWWRACGQRRLTLFFKTTT